LLENIFKYFQSNSTTESGKRKLRKGRRIDDNPGYVSGLKSSGMEENVTDRERGRKKQIQRQRKTDTVSKGRGNR
jgi:hypothetical protein